MTTEQRLFHLLLAKGIDNAYAAAGAVENLFDGVEVEIYLSDISEGHDPARDLPIVQFLLSKEDEDELGGVHGVSSAMSFTSQTMRNRMVSVLKKLGQKPKRGMVV